MKNEVFAGLVVAAGVMASCSQASPPVQSAEDRAVETNEAANTEVMPSGGSGPYVAYAISMSALDGYTVYRPVASDGAPWPVLIWGNGACRANGLQHADFLREIASHGYFVIALGEPKFVYDGVRREEPAEARSGNGERTTDDETSLAQMISAMDWAQADASSGLLDAEHLAVAGHSCGGLQATAASADPRVDTSLIFNSGVYIPNPDAVTRSAIVVEKSDLLKFHGPVAYFDGGPEDIAHLNNLDDFERVNHVPVFRAELPVGHSGTFWSEPNGGAWAEAAILWLDWHLKGKDENAAFFVEGDVSFTSRDDWSMDWKAPT